MSIQTVYPLLYKLYTSANKRSHDVSFMRMPSNVIMPNATSIEHTKIEIKIGKKNSKKLTSIKVAISVFHLLIGYQLLRLI